MKTINADNTYVLKVDPNGNVIEGQYCDTGTTIITNADAVPNETIKVNDLTTEQVDWAIQHAAENGITGEVLMLESEPRSALSDLAVNTLIEQDKLIITVAP